MVVNQTELLHHTLPSNVVNEALDLISKQEVNMNFPDLIFNDERMPVKYREPFQMCFYSLVNNISHEIGINLWTIFSWITNAKLIQWRYGEFKTEA